MSGDTVDVNTATSMQLRALLGLSDAELATVLAARPFATAPAFQAALPSRLAAQGASLALPKLDINAATAADLSATLGIPPDVAATIAAGKPYFTMTEIRMTPNVSALYDQIAAVYQVAGVSYPDKLSGRVVDLAVDPSHVLVPQSQTEDAAGTAMLKHLGLTKVASADKASHALFAIPDTEAADDVLKQLKAQYGAALLLPSRP